MHLILGYLKSRNGLRSKGNTIKKSAHLAQTRDGQQKCDRFDLETGNKDHIFPLGHYTPRPSPRGFIVREVRKVSSCNSPSEPGTNQISAVDSNFGSIGTHHVISACSSQISTTSAPFSDPSTKEVSQIRPLIRQSTGNSKLNVKGTKANTHSRPAFNMLLGQQDPASSYFTRRYFRLAGLPASRNALDVSKNTIHCMSTLDPHAFELFKLYTSTSKVAFHVPEDFVKKHLWMACWPLLNAHILGCTIEEPEFADKVMDAIVYKLAPGTCPDVETVTHLFTNDWEGVSPALRQFVIDCFIDAPEADREHLAVSDIPKSFSQLALQTALRCSSRASNATVLSGCKYHIHGTKEACYKTRISPANALKEQKLAEAREMSAKDAKVVGANVINNGVKSVDWAERRADAIRALRAETGRSRVGFERLEDVRVPKKSSGLIVTSVTRKADDKIKDECDPDPTRTSQKATLLTNGTTPTLDLTRTSNKSPVVYGRIDHKNSAATALPFVQRSSESSGPGITSKSEPSDCDPQHFGPAELDGSTNYSFNPSMDALQKHKMVTNRTSVIGGRPLQDNMAGLRANGAREKSVIKQGPSCSTWLSIYDVEKAVMEYERGVRCPGAYPESNVGDQEARSVSYSG